jgi:3'-5' exonuclease
MEIACFDIETIPHQNLPENVKPEFDPKSVKHGNTKDPTKRAAKESAERAKFNNTIIKTMSLHPDLCEVVCFGGMIFDTVTGEHEDTIITGDEDAVKGAWEWIMAATRTFTPLVSYNGIAFDLRVLMHRAIDLHIPVSGRVYHEITRRYSITYHFDLMQVMADWDRQSWMGLDFWLKRFGIGQKNGSGGDVYQMYLDGKIKEIGEYCLNDVLLTARLFSRVEPWVIRGAGLEDA